MYVYIRVYMYTQNVKCIWLRSKIFISHSKSVFFLMKKFKYHTGFIYYT